MIIQKQAHPLHHRFAIELLFCLFFIKHSMFITDKETFNTWALGFWAWTGEDKLTPLCTGTCATYQFYIYIAIGQ